MAFYRLKEWFQTFWQDLYQTINPLESYRKQRIKILEDSIEQFLQVWGEVSKYHFTDRELVEAIKNLSKVYHGG